MEYTFKILTGAGKGSIMSVELKMSEYDEFVAANPELERYIGEAPAVTYNGRTFGKTIDQTDNTFKEVLAKIGENHTSSPLAERYRKNKTINEIKTKQVVDHHRKKSRDAAKAAVERRRPKFS